MERRARGQHVADIAPTTAREWTCIACNTPQPIAAFSRNQLAKPQPKCQRCVTSALATAKTEQELVRKLKRCVQCFQDRTKDEFSKRQYIQLDGKCIRCVAQLEKDAVKNSNTATGKWCYDQYYRCSHRGKSGGVGVRTKCNIASPLLGTIPLGRVFKATHVVFNEQGDPMVKLESLSCVEDPATSSSNDVPLKKVLKHREGWVPCRSIRNEIFIEPHSGPWPCGPDPTPSSSSSSCSRFFRCVIEGCKVRAAPDLSQVEIGYILYGDVVEVVQCRVTCDGVVFLQLHTKYFDGAAWVVERTLDNESVLNQIQGPSIAQEAYRCVQDGGAPSRLEPSLAAPPVGRIPCGTVVQIVERVVTSERHVFLKMQVAQDALPLYVIETSTVCASVMVRCDPLGTTHHS